MIPLWHMCLLKDMLRRLGGTLALRDRWRYQGCEHRVAGAALLFTIVKVHPWLRWLFQWVFDEGFVSGWAAFYPVDYAERFCFIVYFSTHRCNQEKYLFNINVRFHLLTHARGQQSNFTSWSLFGRIALQWSNILVFSNTFSQRPINHE